MKKESGTIAQRTVLFVEHSRKGELASELRGLMSRLPPTLKFGVKIVERTGTALRNMFGQGSLWDGAQCGRGQGECVTCHQECEVLPPCTRVSLVYENICTKCNPDAGGKKEIKKIKDDPPSVYIGETSRSIQERAAEHHADLRNRREKSHMLKHQVLHHNQEDTPFVMRAVSYHRSALSRQAAEAVRIMRRGGEGAILNSKGEFNRCFIPRLMLIEEDKLKELEEMDKEENRRTEFTIKENQEAWESSRIRKRRNDMKNDLDRTGRQGQKSKNPRDSQGSGSSLGRAKKRMKYQLMEDDWGEAPKIEDPGIEGEDAQEDQEARMPEEKEPGDTVLELCSSNLPDPETLQACQDSPDSLEEILTAGAGQERDLLHPSVTMTGHLDVHAEHEVTQSQRDKMQTNELREEHPSAERINSEGRQIPEEYEEEQTSRKSYDIPAPSLRLLNFQEALSGYPALLPSVERGGEVITAGSINDMKTTSGGGVVSEHTPSRLMIIPDHLEGVKDIQEHRDVKIPRIVCSPQTTNTELQPSPTQWKDHPLLNRKLKPLPSPASTKKQSNKKKVKENQKLSNVKKKENMKNDIRKYYTTKFDRMKLNTGENDRDVGDRYEDDCDANALLSTQTAQNDIENDCGVTQRPNTSQNLLPGVTEISTTVHLYSEDRPAWKRSGGAEGRLLTHVGLNQSDLRNDDVVSRQTGDWQLDET